MSVHQANKPVEINDSVKELARVVLNDRMEPFKAEIQAKLAAFGGHKKQLLRHLRDALGPKAEPLDEAKSWFGIETTAYQYFALQILKHTVMDHEARYAPRNAQKKRWRRQGGPIMDATC
jgi:hypothetical protein